MKAALVVVAVVVWSAFRLWPQYRLDAAGWSVQKYGSQFVDARALGAELGAELSPQQQLFVFGVFPGIYEAAGRAPPSGIINPWFALPHYGFGISAALSQRLLTELQRDPPDVVVLDAETWALAGPGEPIREWIASHYRVIGDRHNFAVAQLVRIRAGDP